MGDFKISTGGEYDLTRSTLKGVKSENVAKKGKLLEIFNSFDLDHDGELNTIEFAKVLDYFNSLDKDNGSADGILSKNEFAQGAEGLSNALGLDGKNKIDPKDAKRFIENIIKLTKDTDHINIEELFFFLNADSENGEFDIQNIVNAEMERDSELRGGGNLGSYTLTYASGTVIKVNANKTYTITKKDPKTGKTTVASYDSNKNLLKQVTTDLENNVETINYLTVTDENTKQPVTVINGKSVVYANGDTEDTEYICDGKESYPSKMTQVTNENGVRTTSVVNYIGGVSVSEITTKGDAEFTYLCTDSDFRLGKKVENKGSENERITLYTYNDNNTVTVSITEGNRVTKQIRAIPLGGNARSVINDERTITCESILDETDVTTDIIYLGEGHGNERIECVTDKNGKVTKNLYNENGKRTDSVVELNGQCYTAEYDGQGNTYMVFTIDDPLRITKLAGSFGTTPEAIFNLNKNLVHIDKTTGAKYFVAGTKIKIPGEISADNRYLRARGSQEYETARGNQLWGDITEAVNAESASRSTSLVRCYEKGNFSNFRDFALYLFAQEGNSNPNRYMVDARVNELKDMNRGLVDGKLSGKTIRFKYTATKEEEVHRQNIDAQRRQNKIRRQNEDRAAAPIAKKIYNIIDGESYAVERHGGDALVRDINGSNVISVLEKYKELSDEKESLFTQINAEWDNTTNDIYNVAAMKHIINALVDRCRSTGINENNVMQFYNEAFSYIDKFDIDKLNILVDKMCDKCRLLESATREETAESIQRGVSLTEATFQGLDLHANDAHDTLTSFNKNEETTFGRIWEGIKYIGTLGTSNSLDEKVFGDIKEFKGYITQLEDAYKTGGEKDFKVKFKNIFGVEFDERIARQYAVKLENYENAVAVQGLMDVVKDFKHQMAEMHQNTEFETWSMSNLVSCYKEILKKIDPQNKNLDAAIEKTIMSKLGNNYSNATTKQRRAALVSAMYDFMAKMDDEYRRYSGGKSLDEFKGELSQYSRTLFGTKHDMIDRANDYMAGQKAADAYISTGLKVAAMATFGLAGGGVLLSAGGTFVSSMLVDVVDHPEALGDRSKMLEFFEGAAFDASLSGLGTFLRDGLKAGKLVFGSKSIDIRRVVNITKGNASFAKTQGVLIGADSTVSTTGQIVKGGYKPENIGITLLWSTFAHFASAKIVKGSNTQRAIRRSVKGGGKEQRVANKTFTPGNAVSGELTIEQMSAQCKEYLASITNLGDLNAMRRYISQIPEEYGRANVVALIEERTNELLANKTMTVAEKIPLSSETRTNALRALGQPAKHLLPQQIEDVMDYIDSIVEPNELYQVMTRLQEHGIDLAEQSDLRTVLDDKFAEFNRMPTYPVGDDFILYAHTQQGPGKPEAPSLNSALEAFMNSKDPVISMLDAEDYKAIKNGLMDCSKMVKTSDDVNNLLAHVNALQDETQRSELQSLIMSIARVNGISVT